MKKFKYFILVLIVLPVMIMFAGCSSPVYVTNIEKTGANGDTIIYTVYYSNGTTSTISVDKGADGENGKNGFTIEELFNECVKAGMYNETEFTTFLSDYIDGKVETRLSIYQSMNSATMIYATFPYSGGREFVGTHIKDKIYYSYSIGSGVIWQMKDDTSYIVTNSHVITNKDSLVGSALPKDVYIYLYGSTPTKKLYSADNSGYITSYEFSGNYITAEVVGYTVDYDLAVLKVNTADLLKYNKDATAITLADNYSLGEEAFAIGNAEGEGISVTSGIVSVESEQVAVNMPADDVDHIFRVLRMDTAIYSGNSGGGVFNKFGKLIGIASAGAEYGDNFNFAIPLDAVKPAINNILHYYENKNQKTYMNLKQVTIDELGVELENKSNNQNPFDEQTGNLSYDVTVINLNDGILKNSRMEKNDIITRVVIDGIDYSISIDYQINDALINARANSTITFYVTRNNVSDVAVHLQPDLIVNLF